MVVPDLPESLTRRQVARFVELLGMDPKQVRSVDLLPSCVYVTAFALDADGKKFSDGDTAATHRVCIPIVE